MKIIGLTGPSGAGKGACHIFFAEKNIPCIDADKIYHDLLIPPSDCLNELVDTFSADILNGDGTLNRTKLGEIVFHDDEKLNTLNLITHKYVLSKIEKKLAELNITGKHTAVIDAPLLFESGLDKKCDFTVAVIADRATRASRIMERDHISLQKAEMRINAQKSDEYYTSKASYTIKNDDSVSKLKNKLSSILFKENLQ